MRHLVHRRLATVLTVALGLALGTPAAPARAQHTAPPPRSPMMIRGLIEKSLVLQREAVATLDDPDRAVKIVYDAYVQIRAAHGHLVINASNMKYPDPLFPSTDKRVSQVRSLILRAKWALDSRNQWSGKGNPIDVAREALGESIRVTQTILATTF